MFRRLQRAALPTAAIAAALSLAGCSHQTESATPTPDFGSGVAVTPGMSGMGTTGSMPGMSGLSNMPAAVTPELPAPGANAVNIDDFAFVPATLTVKPGATVTWTNHDEDPHTVVDGKGAFRSETLGSGSTYTFTFTNAGTYDYVCSIHPFMRGTVVVTP